MNKNTDGVRPCWEVLRCIPVINEPEACPAVDAWRNNKYCFEITDSFCARVLSTIRNGGSLRACTACGYFNMVKVVLGPGVAMDKLIKAKLEQ